VINDQYLLQTGQAPGEFTQDQFRTITILNVRGMHNHHKEQAERIHQNMTFTPSD
jgi:hypothetical protein